jgi:hypothetical protein
VRGERAWAAALAEHAAAVDELARQLGRVAPARWHEPVREHAWSPAEEALHVTLAYELARPAVQGSAGMRPRVSPARARLLRWLLLPALLRTGVFPRRVPAPREIRPDRAEAGALSAAALQARLRAAASDAAGALHDAGTRSPRIRVPHAYFGPLAPLVTLRLLSAHTRHHARRFAARAPAGDPGA